MVMLSFFVTINCNIVLLCLEASLTGVEPLMQKIHNEIRRVDTEILAAVRQQVQSNSTR